MLRFYSESADSRLVVREKKVLSYCLFIADNSDNWFVSNGLATENQKQQLYWIGLYRNLRMANTMFPDWEFRIYYNDSVASNAHLLRAQQHYPDAKFINTQETWPQRGKSLFLARMLPMLEEDVAFCICLDLDNVLTEALREETNRWVTGDKILFVPDISSDIRYKIPGGCFGLGPKRDVKYLKQEMDKFIDSNPAFEYGFDEELLLSIIPDAYMNAAYVSKPADRLLADVGGKITSELKRLPNSNKKRRRLA